MKNQIYIEPPVNAKYLPNMILMEKGVLASKLKHESGKTFIRPIFKAFFPQIDNGEELTVDDIQLTGEPLAEYPLSGLMESLPIQIKEIVIY